jgi:hypothetical protein
MDTKKKWMRVIAWICVIAMVVTSGILIGSSFF